MLFETPNSEGWRLNFLPEISTRFPNSLAILSPDFMVAAEEVWRNVSGEVAQKGEACLAMKRCVLLFRVGVEGAVAGRESMRMREGERERSHCWPACATRACPAHHSTPGSLQGEYRVPRL